MEDQYQTIWLPNETRTLYNPLVVLLGIGDYGNNLPNLPGVATDCNNARYVFNNVRGYSMVYMDQAGQLVHMIHSQVGSQRNFKLSWSHREITEYNSEIKRIFTTEIGRNYDALIYIASSHGDVDVIYDSNSDKVKLSEIFNSFDNNHCASLHHKTKIFIIDACRGDVTLKFKAMPKTVSNVDSTECKNDKLVDAAKTRLMKPIMDSVAVGMEELQTEIANSGNVESSVQVTDPTITTKFSNRLTPQSDFYIIYSNVAGHASVDGYKKGGYLIRSLLKVVAKNMYFYNYALREIMQYATYVKNALIAQKEGSKNRLETFEEIRKCDYAINFKPKKSPNSVAAVKINAGKSAKPIDTIVTPQVIDEKESKDDQSIDVSNDGKTITVKNYSRMAGYLEINDKYLDKTAKDSVIYIQNCYEGRIRVTENCKTVSIISSPSTEITISSTCTVEKIEIKNCNGSKLVINGTVSSVILTESMKISLEFNQSVCDHNLLPKIVVERATGATQVSIGNVEHSFGVPGDGSFVYAYNYQSHGWHKYDKTIKITNYGDMKDDLVIDESFHRNNIYKDGILISDCYGARFKVTADYKEVSMVSSRSSYITISECKIEEIELKGVDECWVTVNDEVSSITLTKCTQSGVTFDQTVRENNSLPTIVIDRPRSATQVSIGGVNYTMYGIEGESFIYVYNYQTQKWDKMKN